MLVDTQKLVDSWGKCQRSDNCEQAVFILVVTYLYYKKYANSLTNINLYLYLRIQYTIEKIKAIVFDSK